MKSIELAVELTGEFVKTGDVYDKYYLASFKNVGKPLSYLTGVSKESHYDALVNLVKCLA